MPLPYLLPGGIIYVGVSGRYPTNKAARQIACRIKGKLMTITPEFQEGERVRFLHGSATTKPGDEGTITKIIFNKDDTVRGLVVLVDSDPATVHGTTVSPDEIEKCS